MKKYYLNTILLLLVISMWSCEEEFIIDTSDFEPSLVVNSIFSPQSPWKIEISTSKNVLDHESEIRYVDNAEVKVFDMKGVLFAQFDYFGKGVYKITGDKRAIFGQEYLLFVKVPGYDIMRATTSVPGPVNVENVVINREIEFDNPSTIHVDFKIIDWDERSNFFVWELSKRTMLVEPIHRFGFPTQHSEILLSSTDENIESLFGQGLPQTRLFLTDKTFGHGDYSTSFVAVNPHNNSEPEGNDDSIVYPEINLRVMSVSPELYEYFKSLELYRLNNQSNSSFTTPFEIYSNFENGLGIFAGFSETTVALQ